MIGLSLRMLRGVPVVEVKPTGLHVVVRAPSVSPGKRPLRVIRTETEEIVSSDPERAT